METPFSEYKATELPQERLSCYFVEPKYISKMYTNNVAFVIGQRGTGKTTMLKYLCERYNDDIPKSKHLGIYYRFDINKMHSFSGPVLSELEWSQLFSHCFSIEICQELTQLMIKLKKNYSFSCEAKLCKRVARLFLDDSSTYPSSFEDLSEYLDELEISAKRYKRNPLRVMAPLYGECEKTFEEFCKLIAHENFLSGVCIHFLFDEYENMLDYQKRFINSCAKNASYYHTYKICVRPGGNDNMNTLINSEILREADDYKTLYYIDDIIGDESDVQDFMRMACRKRLESYYREKGTQYGASDLDIETYFPQSKSDDELFAILEKNKLYCEKIREKVTFLFNNFGYEYSLPWGLLQMKLFLALSQKRGFNFDETLRAFETKNRKYTNWLNNYKKTILYQCYAEQDEKFCLSGFKDIINIAGNVVRYVLEICDYCFLCTSCSSDGKYLMIDERVQTLATNKVSERRFKQISTIPDFGQEIKQMVLAIGKIFNMYHRDQRLKRFETNHFSIIPRSETEEKYVESEINRAMQMAVIYGVFEVSRSTKITGSSDVPVEDEDYHLHPILTPYFQISWRKKQKCRFTVDQINTFLFGSDERVSKLLTSYLSEMILDSNSPEDKQISFLELKKQCY